jgi:hypothetical protein
MALDYLTILSPIRIKDTLFPTEPKMLKPQWNNLLVVENEQFFQMAVRKD